MNTAKITLQQLQNRFNNNQWPEMMAIEATESGYRLTIHITDNIHWLSGHFPQQAILAGVIQTHWAATLSQCLFNIGADVLQIDNLKFQDVILPEQIISLLLEFNSEKNSVKFSYTSSDKHFSEGKIVFANNLLEGLVE